MAYFSFRFAAVNDLDFISQLADNVFSVYGNYDEMVADWLLDSGVTTIIVTEKTDPLGFAMLELKREPRLVPAIGQLLAIAVIPEYQRHGVGMALLTQIETLAVDHGLGGIQLHTAVDNIPGVSFFRKAGYRVVRSQDSYYPRGQPALLMLKMLGP
ncbi:MAG: GNAT family N-acetyltransferase [Deltaproteobacteria bacterium]|nr:MAG: GNAT family N-acetyltransferase [Deltaproteobacteria bacterium]